MAFEVKDFVDYVAHNQDELIAKVTLEPQTVAEVSNIAGVKYKEGLTFVDVDPTIQDGSECGYSEGGNTTLTERILEVAPLKVNMGWCIKKLRKSWMNDKLTTRAGAEALPFEAKIVGEVIKNTKLKNEKLIWQSDKALTGDMAHFDGLLKHIKDGGAEVQLSKAFNATNAISIVDAVALAIPDVIVAQGNAVIYMPISYFRIYQDALVKANMVHFSGEQTGTFEIYKPGTSIKVKGMVGLEGSKAVVGCNPKNLIVGMDLDNDEERAEMYFDRSSGEVRLEIEYKLGSQVYFPDAVVYFVDTTATR